MSYKLLALDQNTPQIVEQFIRNSVDMLFHDVHCMLRLPIREVDLEAGCNFSVANALLDLISGFSSLLTPNFDTTRDSGNQFKEILRNYYPWDLQPPVGNTQERAIDDIYKYFRNPLTHSLGLKTEGNYLVMIDKNSISETNIEQLEQSASSPGPAITYLPITLKNEEIEQITLNAPNFYWGVRRTLTNLSADNQRMQDIANGLVRHGYK